MRGIGARGAMYYSYYYLSRRYGSGNGVEDCALNDFASGVALIGVLNATTVVP